MTSQSVTILNFYLLFISQVDSHLNNAVIRWDAIKMGGGIKGYKGECTFMILSKTILWPHALSLLNWDVLEFK